MRATTKPPAQRAAVSGSRPVLSPDTERVIVGLAAVVRMARARERISQAELACRAGLSANFVSAVERAKANPTVMRLGRLARGLGLAGTQELLARADDAARRITAATLSE
jgi:transcriptional regulator with XRE-family HTH domain